MIRRKGEYQIGRVAEIISTADRMSSYLIDFEDKQGPRKVEVPSSRVYGGMMFKNHSRRGEPSSTKPKKLKVGDLIIYDDTEKSVYLHMKAEEVARRARSAFEQVIERGFQRWLADRARRRGETKEE